MKRTGSVTRYWLAALAITALILILPAGAQTQAQPPAGTQMQVPQTQAPPAGTQQAPQTEQRMAPQDRDADLTRRQLAEFDRFLDNHPELAEQLRKDPSLVNDRRFVENHPALDRYLHDHPELRADLRENPNVVMHQEERYERHEDQSSDRDRDRNRDRNDITRGELASMDHFLDNHPEIAEQLRKNPSLVDDRKFVDSHPALQQYLAQHPEVRQEIRENPQAFMHAEERYDRHEDDMHRDHDWNRDHLASFNQFLKGHDNISGELSRNPELATNHEYLENHPELREYLKANPGVRDELGQNPQSFVTTAQQFETSHKTWTAEPKSK